MWRTGVITLVMAFSFHASSLAETRPRPKTANISSIYRDAVDLALSEALDGHLKEGGDTLFKAAKDPSVSQYEVQLLSSYAAVLFMAAKDEISARKVKDFCYQEAPIAIGDKSCGVVLSIISKGSPLAKSVIYEMAQRWLRSADSRWSLGRVAAKIGKPLDQPGQVISPKPDASAAVAPQAVRTGKRVALIIGNSSYTSMGALPNPGRDANLMAATLRKAGFEVELLLDGSQQNMKRAIMRFGQKLTAAGTGTTGLFYYGGHGLQLNGINYLVPIDATMARKEDVYVEGVAAEDVLHQMEGSAVSTRIVILDACRNTPMWPSRTRGDGSVGLARMDAPTGSFVAYSTAPGATASDGTGLNSPFAAALSREILKPAQPIEVVFREVRRAVIKETSGEQTPWDSSSMTGVFQFIE